jgi:alkylation response protein AidB-like acyl-CoA dehydrogenase
MWPAEYGGRGCSLREGLIIDEEYQRAGGPPRLAENGRVLLAPTIMSFGTDAQKAKYLSAIASGEMIWAQSWSEPGAGSDLASLSSTAVADENGWRLRGQKIWSSFAHVADRGFGLFRTGSREDRHRGLTYFLFDLKAEGVTVRPIPRWDGISTFAEIFLDDVYVPAEDVLGPVGSGWQVAMATTGPERGFMLRGPGRFLADAARLVGLAKSAGFSPTSATAERAVAAMLDAEAYQLRTLATIAKTEDGVEIGAESSYDKLFWTDLFRRIAALGLELANPAPSGWNLDPEQNHWLDRYIDSFSATIWGGTNEIQHNILAQRVLDLPRST